MEASIQAFMNNILHLPLWVIALFFFASALLQIVFPPYPGDSVFIFGGYLASTILMPGYATVFVPYVIGTVLSSIAFYELGRNRGESLLGMKLVKKYFSNTHQLKAKNWIGKYGAASLLLCKFFPGVNSIIIIFSGIFLLKRFWAYTAILTACIVHNMAFFLIGKTVGNNWSNISKFLSLYNKAAISLLVLGILIYVSFIIRLRLRKKAVDA